ncbi:MAG TPA: substrate-binding domain-containing protein [Trebonia sp.]
MHSATARFPALAAAAAAALLLAVGAAGSAAASPARPGVESGAAPAIASRPAPADAGTVKVQISIGDFNGTFRAMAKLKLVTKAGRGLVGVILPDTLSSDRFGRFDAPYLKRAFATAGLPASQLKVASAHGADATQLAEAQADITLGAKALIPDPLDSGVGGAIESIAAAHGVPVIDYDQFTLGGSRRYYVSFNVVAVGRTLGRGLVSCVSAWGVKKPQVIIMNGGSAGSTATRLAAGYDQVLSPYFKSGKWALVSEPAGTWDPPTAAAEFRQQYAKHPGLNSALIPDDENAAPIISFLQGQRIKARTFPITGQDATLTGLRNILGGYQCGTAYKPDYLEAQGAAALALFLRAGLKPPASLLNAQFKDPSGKKASVPSMLFGPVWVTTKNLKSTVVADKYVSVSQLCKGYATACKAAGITG